MSIVSKNRIAFIQLHYYIFFSFHVSLTILFCLFSLPIVFVNFISFHLIRIFSVPFSHLPTLWIEFRFNYKVFFFCSSHFYSASPLERIRFEEFCCDGFFFLSSVIFPLHKECADSVFLFVFFFFCLVAFLFHCISARNIAMIRNEMNERIEIIFQRCRRRKKIYMCRVLLNDDDCY